MPYHPKDWKLESSKYIFNVDFFSFNKQHLVAFIKCFLIIYINVTGVAIWIIILVIMLHSYVKTEINVFLVGSYVQGLNKDAPLMFDSCTLPLVYFDTSSWVTSPPTRFSSSMLSIRIIGTLGGSHYFFCITVLAHCSCMCMPYASTFSTLNTLKLVKIIQFRIWVRRTFFSCWSHWCRSLLWFVEVLFFHIFLKFFAMSARELPMYRCGSSSLSGLVTGTYVLA